MGAALLLVAAPLALSGEAGGKPDKEKEEEFDPKTIVEQDDEATGLLRAAWRARDAGNLRLAIDKYLEVARKYGNTVFPQTERLYLPLSVLVQRELTGLPREGQELYRVLKGREAEQALERALRALDERAMERVAAEYPGLDAAPRALYMLGERARAAGDNSRAVLYWRRLLAEYPEWGGASRVSVLARAALVAAESGRRTEAEKLLEQLRQTAGLARLRVGAKELLVADEIDKKLKAEGVGSTAPESGSGTWWPTIGGDGSHAGCAPRSVDAGVCRWKKPLSAASSPANEQYYRNMGMDPKSMPATSPRRHPVAVGGMVILAGDNDVVAFRAMTGNVVWKAPAGTAKEDLPASRQTLPAIGDGRAYVCMGQPGQPNPQQFGMRPQGEGNSQVKLRAFGLESGKLLWESGRNEDKAVADFLKTVDLMSAPVYSGGYVYCPAVKRGSLTDVYMTCFDAATGRLCWKTFVCAAQPLSAGPYYYRALKTAEDCLPAAISDGLVAVVTNSGGLAVMDAGSGQLLWIYLYDRLEISAGRDRFGGVSQPAVIKSWAASAPVMANGMFYAAPQDCGDILALDLASGKRAWKTGRGSLTHLVGVGGGRVIASGGKEVVAFSAVNGKRLWAAKLDAEEAGLGLLGRDFVMVPTTAGLCRFDLETGKLKSSYQFRTGDAEGGNLVISGDALVSVGNKGMAGYYSWDEIVAKMQAEIAQNPEAAAPRAGLAEVYFAGERYAEAIKTFQEALERVKPEEMRDGVSLKTNIRKQTWESYFRLGAAAEKKDNDAAAALKSYLEGHKYCANKQDEMLGCLSQARCREALGEFAGAVGDYQSVITRVPDETYTSDRSGQGQVQAGRFAQVQIDRLIKAKGREVYATLDAEAGEILRKAREGKSTALAQEVVRKYPNSLAVSPALILAGELAMAAGKPAEASAALREHLWKRAGGEREVEVRARLAMAYRAQGMESLCRGMLNRLLRTFPDKDFELDGRAWSVKEFVADRLPRDGGAKGSGAWALPDLTPPLTTMWKAPNLAMNYMTPVPAAASGEGSGVAYFLCDARKIIALDAASGKLLWKTPENFLPNPNQGLMASLYSSGVVLVAAGAKLKALSTGTGELAWEADLPLQEQPGGNIQGQVSLAAGEGVAFVATNSWTSDPRTGAQTGKRQIMAIDEGTGQKIWSGGEENSSRFGGGYALVTIAEGLALLSSQNEVGRGTVNAYDLADGKKRYSIALPGQPQGLRIYGELMLASSGPVIEAYDLATGKLKWRASATARGVVNNMVIVAVDDTRLVTVSYTFDRAAGGQKSQLTAYDMKNGKQLWASEALEGAASIGHNQFSYGQQPAPAQATDRLALTLMNQRAQKWELLVLDGKEGKLLWRSDLPGPCSPVIGARHVAALATVQKNNSGELRVWNIDTGKLMEARPCDPGQFICAEGTIYALTRGSVERLKAGAPKPASSPGPGK